jgi:hypothetical protein
LKPDYKYKKIVIGVDQSYTNTGLAVIADGTVVKALLVPFSSAQNKPEKRIAVARYIADIVERALTMAPKVIVVCEQIRAFKGSSLSLEYVATTGALVGTIVDRCFLLGVPVYSVDTRVWKARIVGTCKPDARNCPPCVEPQKWPTIKFILKRTDVKKSWITAPVTKRSKKYDLMYKNERCRYLDDVADAICIGLYGNEKGRNMHKEW